jgi:hypothetical protein
MLEKGKKETCMISIGKGYRKTPVQSQKKTLRVPPEALSQRIREQRMPFSIETSRSEGQA